MLAVAVTPAAGDDDEDDDDDDVGDTLKISSFLEVRRRDSQQSAPRALKRMY